MHVGEDKGWGYFPFARHACTRAPQCAPFISPCLVRDAWALPSLIGALAQPACSMFLASTQVSVTWRASFDASICCIHRKNETAVTEILLTGVFFYLMWIELILYSETICDNHRWYTVRRGNIYTRKSSYQQRQASENKPFHELAYDRVHYNSIMLSTR